MNRNRLPTTPPIEGPLRFQQLIRSYFTQGLALPKYAEEAKGRQRAAGGDHRSAPIGTERSGESADLTSVPIGADVDGSVPIGAEPFPHANSPIKRATAEAAADAGLPRTKCCSTSGALSWVQELTSDALGGNESAQRLLPDVIAHYLIIIRQARP